MTNLKHTPADSILVAIDVSHQRNDVLIETPGISRPHRLVVLNTRVEHDRFIDRLSHIGRPVIVGFEATGNYHRPLAYRLLKAGFELRLVSSVALARTREALHNGWDKNDPKDAQVILHMLKIGATQIYSDPSARALTISRNCQKHTRSSPRPRPSSGTDCSPITCRSTFPRLPALLAIRAATGFWPFSSGSRCQPVLEHVKEQFIDQAWGVVGRKVSKARLLGDIYETAKTSIGLPVAMNSPAIAMFRLIIAEGRSLIRQRDAIEEQAHAAAGRKR